MHFLPHFLNYAANCFSHHLGGNQRDLARAKNAKKNQDAAKAKNDDGLTPAQRRER